MQQSNDWSKLIKKYKIISELGQWPTFGFAQRLLVTY